MKNLLLIPLFILLSSFYTTKEYKVVRTIDGDSIIVLIDGKQVRIRLAYVDAPEHEQPYGMEAKEYTAAFIGNSPVTLDIIETDKYGRLVAMVYVNYLGKERNLNEALLENGLCYHYSYFDHSANAKRWQNIEDSCRINHIGLWKDLSPINPSEWRKKHKKNG